MAFLLFLICLVSAIVLYVVLKKLVFNKFKAFFRVVISLITFLLFIAGSILGCN